MTLLTLKTLHIHIYTLCSGYHLLCWSPKSQMISCKADLPGSRKRHLSMVGTMHIMSVDMWVGQNTFLFAIQDRKNAFASEARSTLFEDTLQLRIRTNCTLTQVDRSNLLKINKKLSTGVQDRDEMQNLRYQRDYKLVTNTKNSRVVLDIIKDGCKSATFLLIFIEEIDCQRSVIP